MSSLLYLTRTLRDCYGMPPTSGVLYRTITAICNNTIIGLLESEIRSRLISFWVGFTLKIHMENDIEYNDKVNEESPNVHHSPESAGIVRGLSKSSKAFTKLRRPPIKIKPKLRTAPKLSKIPKAPKVKTPVRLKKIPKSPQTTPTFPTKGSKHVKIKNAGGRVKSKLIVNKTNGGNLKNNVAKLSDRASKGVDVVSSIDETLVSDSNNNNKESKRNVFQKMLFQKTAILNFVSSKYVDHFFSSIRYAHVKCVVSFFVNHFIYRCRSSSKYNIRSISICYL